MKSKFLVLVVLVCLLTLVFVSCGGGQSAYYGTWVTDDGKTRLEISANKIIWRGDASGNAYTFENLNWLPIDMTDSRHAVNYPKGFEVSGTYTDSSIASSIGRTERKRFYLHNNKGSLLDGSSEYRKQ